MIVKYVWGAAANHRKMAGKIETFDLPSEEKQFLKRSLYRTTAYECGILGPMYYKLGGGTKYVPEVLCSTGDLMFFTRIIDNVIDGHVTNTPIDYDSREAFLYGTVDYLSGISEEAELGRSVPKELGVKGALEITKIVKSNLPEKTDRTFRDDFLALAEVCLENDTFDSLSEYERNLTRKGGSFALVVFDTVSMYPDYFDSDFETTRNFVRDIGAWSQIVDDLKDGDHYYCNWDKLRLLKKHTTGLKKYYDKEPRFREFERSTCEGFVLIGLSHLGPCKALRNHFPVDGLLNPHCLQIK